MRDSRVSWCQDFLLSNFYGAVAQLRQWTLSIAWSNSWQISPVRGKYLHVKDTNSGQLGKWYNVEGIKVLYNLTWNSELLTEVVRRSLWLVTISKSCEIGTHTSQKRSEISSSEDSRVFIVINMVKTGNSTEEYSEIVYLRAMADCSYSQLQCW